MPHFFDPERIRLQKLEKFRQSFLLIVAGGTYPIEGQQRLYAACQKASLDWQDALEYIAPDALTFLRTVVARIVADSRITPGEMQDLRRLQRRLGFANNQALPVLDNIYNLVERRLEQLIIERAAYLSSPGLIPILEQEITSYALSPEREQRLLAVIDRQHRLAKLMAGTLPNVVPSVDLYADEQCHLDVPVTFIPERAAARAAVGGKLVATSKRLLLLGSSDGFSASWPQLIKIKPEPHCVLIATIGYSWQVYSTDYQYLATLLTTARNVYMPRAEAAPKRSNKRLM